MDAHSGVVSREGAKGAGGVAFVFFCFFFFGAALDVLRLLVLHPQAASALTKGTQTPGHPFPPLPPSPPPLYGNYMISNPYPSTNRPPGNKCDRWLGGCVDRCVRRHPGTSEESSGGACPQPQPPHRFANRHQLLQAGWHAGVAQGTPSRGGRERTGGGVGGMDLWGWGRWVRER